MKYLSLKELCEELSISVATGRNWVKLGKIVPEFTEQRTPFFSKAYVDKLKKDIQSGSNASLKSRRNKKYVSGNDLYRSYVSDQCKNVEKIEHLLQMIRWNKIRLNEKKIQILLADCAVKLFAQRFGKETSESDTVLLDFIEGRLDFGERNQLIDNLVIDKNETKTWLEENQVLFETAYEYEEQEDVIGLLYISCKNVRNRKATGAYYTPTKVVRQLIDKVVEKNGTDGNVLDPCCGTGNFLLQLSESFSMEKIYGNDLDRVSVKVTRLNMALRFPKADVQLICENISNKNYLKNIKAPEVDLIIGNPPWGYSFSKREKEYLKKRFCSAKGKNVESYDVFIEQAMRRLKKNGVLSFVLPEAILNVRSHRAIRKFMIENCSIQYVGFLGNAFDKVQCPCVILQIKNTKERMSCIGMEVNDGSKVFEIRTERKIEPEIFSFLLTDEEFSVLNKLNMIRNVAYLKGNATFALGIVTGDNDVYLSNVKTDENEMILKGQDICKYRIADSENFVLFKPERFQQVAPVECYRAPEKLLYRFISSQLIFAYDDQQRLSLNSCNILIPDIFGLHMKYVLAILNARVAQFIYKKQFNSVKVLRSHLEQIPIPVVDEVQQQEIIDFVERLQDKMSETEALQIYDELDEKIRLLYGLNDVEYQTVKESVDGEHKFLV